MRKKGFTLIEIITVIFILGLIISLIRPKYDKVISRSKEMALKHNLKLIRDALDKYFYVYEKYPENLDELVEKKILREIPKDPVAKESWQIEYLKDRNDVLTNQIYNIRSKSNLKDTNDKEYSSY